MIKKAAAIAGVLLALAATAVVAIAIWPERAGEGDSISTRAGRTAPVSNGVSPNPQPQPSVTVPPEISRTIAISRFGLQPVIGPLAVHYPFKHPPVAGVLFDVRSGAVLWQRHPRLQHPIASLTKMMTALLVARENRPGEHVLVSRKAAQTPGSATGLLPRGKEVPLEALLQALIMISANDAAVALAEHDAGSVTRFVKEMNRQAESMGLDCTHYSTPNGLRDRNNYSWPVDLAELARPDLPNSRLAEIPQTRHAKPRFPINGDHVYPSNTHCLYRRPETSLPQAEV